ncbi:MAG: TRAM domain-containing protein, partial [Anaerolineae bacterium]|nr:TRAM domain-containing protein [Anaerolineae bacterium]
MNDHLTADTFELDLTGMSHGGSAIGRHQGRAIFVPYGVPGDRVRVRIVQDKGRFAVAE